MWLDDLVLAAEQGVDDRVREALYGRGVSDDQIALYRLGFVEKLPNVGYPQHFLDWAKVKFVPQSIVLPLTNAVGDIKGVQFRSIDQGKKGYMDYITEKGEAVLFGLGQAMPHVWASERIVLVEGAFDVFPIQRHLPEATATLTAHVLDALVRVLRRVNVRDLWTAYDNDETGRKSVEKVQKVYGGEFNVRNVTWPQEKMVNGKLTKDPSDLWETLGETKFSNLVRDKFVMERF
jgi:DNA primase